MKKGIRDSFKKPYASSVIPNIFRKLKYRTLEQRKTERLNGILTARRCCKKEHHRMLFTLSKKMHKGGFLKKEGKTDSFGKQTRFVRDKN